MATPPHPAPLIGLAEAAPRATFTVDAAADHNFLDLPARPGVAILEDASGATLLIATTADLREFARRKLGPPSQEPGPPRTDHRAVTARIITVEAASTLEADALYLHEARARMPATHRTVSERWRAWFLHIDPDAEHPQWNKTNLAGLVAPRSASTPRGLDAAPAALPPGLLIGPLADKDTAGRLIERVIDAFDLCRYHNLLVQAPTAAPCAYKEMGRCPAPCDGTESLADYRARIRHAADHLTGPRDAAANTLRDQMTTAAAAHDFARAAILKNALARLEALDAPAFTSLADLRTWSLLLILPTPKPRLVRCLLFANLELTHAGDLPLDTHADSRAREIAVAALSPRAPTALAPTPATIDTIAVISRWLRLPTKTRRGEALPLTSPGQLATSILAAAQRLTRRKPAPAIEERELEVLP